MNLADYIPFFSQQAIMVIGDVILDEYIIGKAERMSREAPVPVLELQEKRYFAGGASNPSYNIVALGGKALQIGVVGKDPAAEQLARVLEEKGVYTHGLFPLDQRPTTLKTRVLAQMGLRFPQQVARIDTLTREPIDAHTQQQILAFVRQEQPAYQAILFSDYQSGLLVHDLVTQIREDASAQGILLAADAQNNLEKYHGFDLVKCNANDAQAYLGQPMATHAEFAEAAKSFVRLLDLNGAMVITRGAEGATLATKEGHIAHCPSPRISDVYDTVGAGDTAIAVMTLARLAGSSWEEAVMLANYASGIVVQHVGNYAPTPPELLHAIEYQDSLD